MTELESFTNVKRSKQQKLAMGLWFKDFIQTNVEALTLYKD